MDFYKTFLATCKKNADKEALICSYANDTFSQLLAKVEQLAGAFDELGMKKGEKLAIYLTNCPQYIYAYLAGLSLGITVIPLDLSLKEDGLKKILAHSEAHYLLANKEIKIPYIKKVITNIDDLISLGEPIGAKPKINEDDLAIIIYTSGTTSIPKAVPLTYKHLDSPVATLDLFLNNNRYLERILCSIPLSHAGGFVYLMNLVGFGATLVLGDRFIPDRFLKELEQYKITCVWLPPSIIEKLLMTKEIDEVSLKSLKAIVYFGAPGNPKLFIDFEKRFPHVKGITGWGMTETAPPNVILPPDTPKEKRYKKGILGKPAPWVEIKIVDEKGKALPPNQIGEILIKGWVVMSGYYKEEELTKEIIKDGWLYSGDLGYLDEGGYLYITDRKKEVIIVGGLNVYASEVEFILSEHQNIEEVAVIGVADALRGEIIKAVIVSKDGITLDEREIISFCRKRLPSYKVPRLIEFKKALPKTPLGKVKKAELR